MSYMKRQPTCIDVAATAGVSQATVSRVLNKSSLVKDSTRDRVLKAAEVLKYKIDNNARFLRSSRVRTLALLILEDMEEQHSDINPFFLPIVAGMGGNAGTQTLTVIVRGIALGELTWGNSRKALFKEAVVGLGNGMVLGLGAALIVWLLRGDPMLGVVLGLAMVVNMFVAAAAGTLVPLGLRAANVDPALASSIFITTMTDVFGFFSYLGLATLFARYLAGG